jgi:putative endonuclease
MTYYVYILKSILSSRYYIGSSENPTRRLEFHNTKEKGFTSRYRPWEIVYEKEFLDKSAAQAVERKIKNWKSRKMIEKLISGELEV